MLCYVFHITTNCAMWRRRVEGQVRMSLLSTHCIQHVRHSVWLSLQLINAMSPCVVEPSSSLKQAYALHHIQFNRSVHSSEASVTHHPHQVQTVCFNVPSFSRNCAVVLMRPVQAMDWQSTTLQIKRRLQYPITDSSPICWQSFRRLSAICLELIANWHSWL